MKIFCSIWNAACQIGKGWFGLYEDTYYYPIKKYSSDKGNTNYAKKPEHKQGIKGALRSVKTKKSESALYIKTQKR